MRYLETTNLQKMRLLKNVITGKKYSIMNKMMNNWILHTKFVLKCKSFVRSILIRKSTTYLRLGFKRWHDIWIQDSIGRRCVVRMSMIVSKQRYLLAMTKWRYINDSLRRKEAHEKIIAVEQQSEQKEIEVREKIKTLEEESKQNETRHMQEVTKLEGKMTLLSRVASKQMNELELKFLKDLEKKSGETQIIQDNLRDKDRRLEAALQSISALQQQLNTSQEKVNDVSQQLEDIRRRAELEKQRCSVLEEKEDNIKKNQSDFQILIEEKNKMLAESRGEIMNMRATVEEGMKDKAVHDFLHQKHNNALLQIQELKTEKTMHVNRLKDDHERSSSEQKQRYESAVLLYTLR